MGNFKNHVRDWTSRKWHSAHNWKTGTGKLIKRTLNKRESQIKDIKFIDKLHNFSSTIDNGQNSFEDTIEIIRNLDLVITTCTSIAHLSSTIGTKTWILLAYNSDWRWFTNTNSTPWYKNTLLFRQEKLNNWESVFEKVKQKLVSDYKLQN